MRALLARICSDRVALEASRLTFGPGRLGALALCDFEAAGALRQRSQACAEEEVWLRVRWLRALAHWRADCEESKRLWKHEIEDAAAIDACVAKLARRRAREYEALEERLSIFKQRRAAVDGEDAAATR